VSGFLNQQYRWCTGSMSLLADKGFHTAQHITFRQRLSFWSGFLYYISTGLNAFVAPLPALAMLYFLPKWIEPMNSIWLIGASPVVRDPPGRDEGPLAGGGPAGAGAVLLRPRRGHLRRSPAAPRSGWPPAPPTPAAPRWRSRSGGYREVYITTSYALLWVGLVRAPLNYGFDQYWAMIALAVIATYVHLPILFISTTPQATIEAPYEPLGPPQSRSGVAPRTAAGCPRPEVMRMPRTTPCGSPRSRSTGAARTRHRRDSRVTRPVT
jgi:hypothetical protein